MAPPIPVDPRAPDPYTVLEVDSAAPTEEIRKAYFSQVRAHPPEREPEAFKRIRAAYERLNTPEARLETDMLRLEPWPEPKLPSLDAPDLTLDPDDVLRAARAFTDLARADWREEFREVKL